jgi:methyl-accepting chemotaxis protein
MNALVNDIASASHEQAQGIEQINNAMADMDRVTQEVAANAEQTAAASEELKGQADVVEGHVRNLSVLVGAQRGNGAMDASGYASEDGASGRKAAPKRVAAPRAQLPGPKEQTSRADSDDDDFSDF